MSLIARSRPLLRISSLRAAVAGLSSESRPVDLTNPFREHLVFDTHQMVENFERSGFSKAQSEEIVRALGDMAAHLVEQQNRTLVSKPQQEITVQQMMSQMAGLRKDMVILEKSEFSALKNENEKMLMDMKMMKQAFHEEIDRVANNIKLDLNLEKSRAREEYNKTGAEVIKLQNRIDTHVANLRTQFEQYRNDMFKYAAGTVLSIAGVALSFYRLYK